MSEPSSELGVAGVAGVAVAALAAAVAGEAWPLAALRVEMAAARWLVGVGPGERRGV